MAGDRESRGQGSGLSAAGQLTPTERTESEFVARAEFERRSGRPLQAKRIALEGLESAPDRHDGRVALALALIDLGDFEEARGQLACYLAPIEQTVSGGGLDPGVSEASQWGVAGGEEPHASSVLDGEVPKRPAEALPSSIRRPGTDAAVPSHAELTGSTIARPTEAEFSLDRSQAFATQTMAGLLEQQGDFTRADVIREQLDEKARVGPGKGAARSEQKPPSHSSRVLETLGVWLRNVQRERP